MPFGGRLRCRLQYAVRIIGRIMYTFDLPITQLVRQLPCLSITSPRPWQQRSSNCFLRQCTVYYGDRGGFRFSARVSSAFGLIPSFAHAPFASADCSPPTVATAIGLFGDSKPHYKYSSAQSRDPFRIINMHKMVFYRDDC